jgi:hypothetical protein
MLLLESEPVPVHVPVASGAGRESVGVPGAATAEGAEGVIIEEFPLQPAANRATQATENTLVITFLLERARR